MDRFEFAFELTNHLIANDEAIPFRVRNGRRLGIHFTANIGDHSIRVTEVEDGYRLRVACGERDYGDELRFAAGQLKGVVVYPGSIRFTTANPLKMARTLAKIADLIDVLGH